MLRSMLPAALLLPLLGTADAADQSYPVRPIRMIVAQSAGSSPDTLARIFTPKLAELLDQQVVIDNRGGTAGPQTKAGRLRALAISSKMRSALLHELPMPDQSGVPGYEYTSRNAVFVPLGTPPAVIAKLHATIRRALADVGVKSLYAAQGLLPAASANPAELAAFVCADFERVGRLVKIAGIKTE